MLIYSDLSDDCEANRNVFRISNLAFHAHLKQIFNHNNDFQLQFYFIL